MNVHMSLKATHSDKLSYKLNGVDVKVLNLLVHSVYITLI